MTGALCQIGFQLFTAWVSTAQHVAQPAGMYVTPDRETIDAIENQRGDEHYAAMDVYKAHYNTCQVCNARRYTQSVIDSIKRTGPRAGCGKGL